MLNSSETTSSPHRWNQIQRLPLHPGIRSLAQYEQAVDHGMVDAVVHRRTLKQTVSQLLRHMSGNPAAEETA